jgi:hypothetical protein
MHKITTGSNNVAVGHNALCTNTTASFNTAVGFQALMDNSTGTYNAALGYRAAFNVSTGCQNTASGYNALYCATTGCKNVAVGTNAGCVITTGHCNIAIGAGSGPTCGSFCNTITIGEVVTASASNYTYIGNNATVCSVVPNISTNCFTTGAFMESNLSSFEIKGNPTGTVLIWKDGKAIPCEEEYDVTVLGVAADNNESPIIIGAEPVLVTGPINEGDFIVTSDKRGHGKKGFSNNLFGKVIAQALESGEGDSYTIKAMIRKM